MGEPMRVLREFSIRQAAQEDFLIGSFIPMVAGEMYMVTNAIYVKHDDYATVEVKGETFRLHFASPTPTCWVFVPAERRGA